MSSTPLLLPKSLKAESSSTARGGYQVYMETFGCQMNEYDTELVRSIMKARGFQFTPVDEEADVILFNTCAFGKMPTIDSMAIWRGIKPGKRSEARDRSLRLYGSEPETRIAGYAIVD